MVSGQTIIPQPEKLQVSSKKSSLAVIIPMYNEQLGAARCVKEVCKVLSEYVPSSRLFVVNDGSQDATLKSLEELRSSGVQFTVVSYPINRGYGAALLEGARTAYASGFDFGLFMDSDLTNDPRLIPLFADAVREPVDVVKASRYVPSGGMLGVPWHRQIISRVGNRVASLLCNVGIRDCTNGFRAVRLSFLQNVTFQERGFPSIVEEVYLLKQAGARFTELPYVLTARTDPQAGSKFRYNFQTFYRYLKYCFLAALVTRTYRNIK
jgi:dolichol-phosphate mannosyltransferase